jgi:hypothetical protein
MSYFFHLYAARYELGDFLLDALNLRRTPGLQRTCRHNEVLDLSMGGQLPAVNTNGAELKRVATWWRGSDDCLRHLSDNTSTGLRYLKYCILRRYSGLMSSLGGAAAGYRQRRVDIRQQIKQAARNLIFSGEELCRPRAGRFRRRLHPDAETRFHRHRDPLHHG